MMNVREFFSVAGAEVSRKRFDVDLSRVMSKPPELKKKIVEIVNLG